MLHKRSFPGAIDRTFTCIRGGHPRDVINVTGKHHAISKRHHQTRWPQKWGFLQRRVWGDGLVFPQRFKLNCCSATEANFVGVDQYKGLFPFFPRHVCRKSKPLVPLISRLVACNSGVVADTDTYKLSTVTLAVHALRRLIKRRIHLSTSKLCRFFRELHRSCTMLAILSVRFSISAI